MTENTEDTSRENGNQYKHTKIIIGGVIAVLIVLVWVRCSSIAHYVLNCALCALLLVLFTLLQIIIFIFIISAPAY